MEKAYHVEYICKGRAGVITEDGLNAYAVEKLFACPDITVITVWILF